MGIRVLYIAQATETCYVVSAASPLGWGIYKQIGISCFLKASVWYHKELRVLESRSSILIKFICMFNSKFILNGLDYDTQIFWNYFENVILRLGKWLLWQMTAGYLNRCGYLYLSQNFVGQRIKWMCPKCHVFHFLSPQTFPKSSLSSSVFLKYLRGSYF